MKSRVLFPALLCLVIAFIARSGAHPLTFNSTITYSSTQPGGGAASVANWTGAAFDAANIGGSGVNANGGANNGTANDASTYVANNQPRQGQTITTGSNANGYDVASFTVRMAGYTSNTASGTNNTGWDLNAYNGPIIVEVGKVSGTTTYATLFKEFYIAGGVGNPGAGSSANGPGTYLTFNLPSPVHLEPNMTYGFDISIGDGSNYFEWLGISGTAAYSGGTAYTRSGATVAPLSGDRVFMVNMTASASAYAPFVHPGTLHTATDLSRMATKVAASAQPWKADYDILAASPYASTGWPAYNIDYINRGGSASNNYTRSQQDAQAIYELALMWKLTGSSAYADHAVYIANTWSDLLGVTGDTNQALAAGICGYLFGIGGELLSTYPGWAAADKQAYKDMMMRVFYPANFTFLWLHFGTPVNKGGNTHYRLNWDADNIASMAAIGILCDNKAVYQQALDFFKYGASNGRAERAVWYIHPDGMGQTEEIGRDQPHNMDGWYTFSLLCQMAWNQGDDLFGWDNNRLLRAWEMNAKYNLGNDVLWAYHRNCDLTYTETIAGGTSFLPMYECVYNHYANVKGIDAPYSKLAMNLLRPEDRPHTEYHPSQVDWLGLGSLTFARDAIATGTAPSGLSANWSKNRVRLYWWGTATATSYQVKRSPTLAGTYTTLGTAVAPDLNYTDTTVSNGSTYYYKVTAVTPGGDLDGAPLEVKQALVTQYTFENTFNDVVGTRHGTAMGGSTGAAGFATGKSGQAASFDGVDDYVQLPVGSGNYQDITLSAWVYWNGGNAWQRVFDFGTEIEKYMMLTVKDGSGKLSFQMTTSRVADGTLTLVGPVMPTATWTHVAVTLNGDTATMYVNGVPVTSGTADKVDPLFGQPYCYLGKSMWNGDALFSGRIDDFRIYNYALSGSDIYALGQSSTNSAPTFTSDPIAKPTATEDVAYSQTIAGSATDANGGTLTYSKGGGPAWLSVASNGALTGTPANADVGENLFVVRVTDPSGATDDANLYVTVGNVNDAPTWTSPTLTKPAVTRDQPYAFALATLAGDASDVDAGDTLTFSKVSGPAWLAVAANGALTGTPGVADVGADVFTVRVTDSTGAFADATLNITVLGFGLRTQLLFENNTNDALGNANGTASGAPVFIPGRTAQSIVLDGVDDVVTLPDGAANYRDITVAAWVYWDGGGNFQRIFDFGDDTSHYLFLTPNSGVGVRFEIINAGTVQQINYATALPTGRWVHVAVTLGGDTGTLYINGAAVAMNTAMTINPDDFRPSFNFIGDSQFSADPLFAGKLDDFRIYNYALSAAEITALLDIAPAPPSGLVGAPRSGRIDLTWTASQGAQTYSVKRSLTSGSGYTTVASGLTAASFSDTGLTNGTPYFYIVTATNAHGESNPSAETSAVPIDLIVHLKFDETTGTTAADSSGGGFDGTLVNGPVFAAGKINNAVVFDGVDDRVTLPAGIANSSAITITTWVWWNGGANSQRIFSFGDDTSNYLNLSPSASAGKLKFGIRFAGGTEQQLLAAAPLATGAWHHVAVTLTGGTGVLYLDGAVAASGAITFTPADITPATNYIADSVNSADPSFSGKVDDFRIYTRALTAAEITAFQSTLTAPQNLTATPGPLQIALAWNAVAQATGYTVKSATTSGGPYTTVASDLTAPSFTHTALPWGTARYYVVSAKNITGESPDSAEAGASPQSPLITVAELRPPTFAYVPANGENEAAYCFTSAASVIGHTYRLQTIDDLATGTWTDLSEPVAGTGAVIEFTASYNPADPRRFYRLLISR